jgi:hypothetical protein
MRESHFPLARRETVVFSEIIAQHFPLAPRLLSMLKMQNVLHEINLMAPTSDGNRRDAGVEPRTRTDETRIGDTSMTSIFSHLDTSRVSSVAKNPRLLDLGATEVQHRFSKAKWKVQWKRGGKILPVLQGKNRRKFRHALTSVFQARDAFFHSENFAVENLEKRIKANNGSEMSGQHIQANNQLPSNTDHSHFGNYRFPGRISSMTSNLRNFLCSGDVEFVPNAVQGLSFSEHF